MYDTSLFTWTPTSSETERKSKGTLVPTYNTLTTSVSCYCVFNKGSKSQQKGHCSVVSHGPLSH